MEQFSRFANNQSWILVDEKISFNTASGWSLFKERGLKGLKVPKAIRESLKTTTEHLVKKKLLKIQFCLMIQTKYFLYLSTITSLPFITPVAHGLAWRKHLLWPVQ